VFKTISHAFLDFLFPTQCCGCQKFGKYLCDDCYGQLHFLCLPINLRLETSFVDEAWAVFSHDPPITKLLYQLKYGSVKDIGTYLGDLIDYTFEVPKADSIVSVPLHSKKEKFRGFNQADVIARQLARQTKLPCHDLLLRRKNTKAQATGMDKAQRAKNTQQLYAINRRTLNKLQRASQHSLPSTVLLIDDVITTGSTLNACAKVLKENGVQKVIGLAITHRA
jgi:competence protein ComFC